MGARERSEQGAWLGSGASYIDRGGEQSVRERGRRSVVASHHGHDGGGSYRRERRRREVGGDGGLIKVIEGGGSVESEVRGRGATAGRLGGVATGAAGGGR
jgi:hypothetical protein